MSAASTPTVKVDAPPLSHRDLDRVEHALLEKIKHPKPDADSSVPPAVFRAGGPMYVVFCNIFNSKIPSAFLG